MVVYTITVQVPPDRMAEAQRAIEERLFEAKLGEAVHPYAQLVLDREIGPEQDIRRWIDRPGLLR